VSRSPSNEFPVVPLWTKATNLHFYRYQSAARLDRLQPIILRHELYIPTVSQLNDPADGRPKIAPMSVEEMLAFLYNASRNPTQTTPAQLRLVQTLYQNIQLHGIETLRRQLSIMINKHVEKYRVLSLSRRWNNLSLWAKYAADHTGYCLEFTNEGSFFAHAVNVFYGESIPMDVNNAEYRKAYFFYCKREEWSNEDEVRLIGLPGTPEITKIDPRWLSRIILGKDMAKDQQKQIRELAEQREPQLEVVHAHFDDLHQELRLRKERPSL